MLRGQCTTVLQVCARGVTLRAAKFSSSSTWSALGPNAPLDLDPSLQDLLRDADMALLKYKPRENTNFGASAAKELEVLEFDDSWTEQTPEDVDEAAIPKERKSPRATFGSKNIGSVFLPIELRDSIEKIINEVDKPRLHEDAKRLFREEKKDGTNLWRTSYDTDYKSWKQTQRHADRDGAAFSSIALPAHYAAIYAILQHVRHRLGDEWKVRSVMDWGSGVGSGLWASMHAFQEASEDLSAAVDSDALLSQSTIMSYLGIERREGLSAMAKKLLEDANVGTTNVRWRRGYTDAEKVQRSDGGDLLALSAFHLSSLPTPIARKEIIKQMWSSGASVLVLIDHDTSAGFASIAEARKQLLHMGRKEQEDPALHADPASGCHIVAPCPHDGACPLFNSGKPTLKCSFSQRLQRPAFLRKTKHVRAGHEDIGYTYVVMRRGTRPSLRQISTGDSASVRNATSDADSAHNIRLEAYDWPRMVFPPLKRSGHVIIDGCTSEGKIMRMTIPRSQGKQPYYDARKSSWGDVFPHKPKNPPQVRLELKNPTNDPTLLPGSDIGKRHVKDKAQDPTSYEKIISDLKESNKVRRRQWSMTADTPAEQ